MGRLRGNARPTAACAPRGRKPRAALRRWRTARSPRVAVAAAPQRLPDLAFKDAHGASASSADWRGRTVLLNLWATWCVPCRKEMPALDALQAKLGGAEFEVVAVNIDTRNPDKPQAWLEGRRRRAASPTTPTTSAKVFQDLKAVGKAFGMPTTLIVDPHGCEIGDARGAGGMGERATA